MFREKRVGKERKQCVHNLDTMHQEMVHTFEKKEASLDSDVSKVEKMKKQIQKLKNLPTKTMLELNTLRESNNTLRRLEEQIEKTRSRSTEMEYYASTQDMLFEYYSNVEEKEKSTISIEDFYNNTRNVEQRDATNQKAILDKYMSIVHPEETSISNSRLGEMVCYGCEVEMVINHAKNWCCPVCGETIQNLTELDTSKSQSKNQYYQEQTKFSVYQRMNHFKEWLKQIQAKENTDIPESVIETVRSELRKMMVTNMEEITYSQVRAILKKTNLAKYYENIFYIVHKISGLPPPTISYDTEMELERLFRQVEEPFQLYKDKNRKNILRYGYILCKLCELLELDDILHCFKLLKNRDKLIRQDNIWKQICIHNKWQFISSV